MSHNIHYSLFISGNNLNFDYIANSISVVWECRKKKSFSKSVADAGLACDLMSYKSIKNSTDGSSLAFCSMKQFINEYQSQLNYIRDMCDCEISVSEYLHTDEGEISDYTLHEDDIRSLSKIGASFDIDLYWYEKYSNAIFDNLSANPKIGFELSLIGDEKGFPILIKFFSSVTQCGYRLENDRLLITFDVIEECSVSDAFQGIKSSLAREKDKLSNLLMDYEAYFTAIIPGKEAYMVLFELTSEDISFMSDIGAGFGVALT